MVVRGTKTKPMAKPFMTLGTDDRCHADIEIDAAQQPGGVAEQGKAEGHQQAAIDVTDQQSHHHHGEPWRRCRAG